MPQRELNDVAQQVLREQLQGREQRAKRKFSDELETFTRQLDSAFHSLSGELHRPRNHLLSLANQTAEELFRSG
ncbi:MAG: hypothetical protein JWN34_5130 [Bryobacterales bacterium]|nr:hypothetical protein [Bryobacterales bacterium]